MSFRSRPITTDLAEARHALGIAIADVYQPGSTFLAVFDETPLQAIDALIKRPAAFGTLRLRRRDADRVIAVSALLNAAVNLIKLQDNEA